MKKVLCIILAMLMLLSLVACAKEAPAEKPAETPAEAPAETPAEAPAEESKYHAIFSVSDPDSVNGMLMPKDLESRADIDKGLPSEKKTGLKIGFCQATLSNPYFVAIQEAAQEACDEYGYEVIFMNAETDGEVMIANCEAFLAQGVDAIVLDP